MGVRMPLTTVVTRTGLRLEPCHRARRGQRAPGFNYPQTMCLGNDGDLYVANRGNENNFGMRVNHVKLGGPGEEELLAEFFHLRRRRTARRPGRSASRSTEQRPRLRLGRMDEHDLGVRRQRQVHPQVGHDRQRRRRAAASGRHRLREERQRHRRRQRQQSPAGLHARTASSSRSAARPAAATASSTSRGASRSTRTATSTSPTGRTTASRSCRRRASS